jgi:hypothetical protein
MYLLLQQALLLHELTLVQIDEHGIRVCVISVCVISVCVIRVCAMCV